MNHSNPPRTSLAELLAAETYVPPLLQAFIIGLENASHSNDVWKLIMKLGQDTYLPYIDFISASSFRDWRKTLFIKTSYKSDWLQAENQDPEVNRWSYFRSHAMHYMTPVMVGLEYVEEYRHLPERRVEVLRKAAGRGLRAGVSFPLRQYAPPQAALISFIGNHSKSEMTQIMKVHGWTLHSAALMGHQRYVQLFMSEFTERNQITPKQLELLALIGQGHQDKMIADRLGVSISAIRQRMNTIHQNTGLHTRSELAALAMTLGLIADPFKTSATDPDTTVEYEQGPIKTVEK